MGLGLACLEMVSARGWWGGLTALIALVPMALALSLGGPWAAAVAGALAMAILGAARGGPAMLVVGFKSVLPGVTLGVGLVRGLPVTVTTLLAAVANLLGVVILLWILAPSGMGPIAY